MIKKSCYINIAATINVFEVGIKIFEQISQENPIVENNGLDQTAHVQSGPSVYSPIMQVILLKLNVSKIVGSGQATVLHMVRGTPFSKHKCGLPLVQPKLVITLSG